MTLPELSDNRFEKLYQKVLKTFVSAKPKFLRRMRRIFLLGFFLFIVIEIGAVGLAIEKLKTHGISTDVARHHFYLARYTLNLFLDTPNIDEFEQSTNTRFTGFNLEESCDDYIADALLGWRNRPGISCAFPYFSGGAPDGASLMWNAYGPDGFVPSDRSLPQYERKKPEGVLRIIMLGGSTMASFGSSPFDSIPGHTQRMLDANRRTGPSGMRYEVINAGVGAYNSAQEYLYLMSELVYYQPDIVVFYDGWNDSTNGHGHFSDAQAAHLRKSKKFRQVPFSSIRSKRHRDIGKYIEQSYETNGAAVILKDAVFRSISNMWRHTGIRFWGSHYKFRQRWKRFWKSIFGIFKKPKKRVSRVEAIKKDYDQRTIKVFEENILHSANLSGTHEFKVLFTLQPIIGVDGKPYAPGRERNSVKSDIGKAKILRRQRFYGAARPMLTRLAEKYVDRKNICFADLSGVFKNVKEPLYVDHGHTNSLGNLIVASGMIKQLTKCGFLPLSSQAN